MTKNGCVHDYKSENTHCDKCCPQVINKEICICAAIQFKKKGKTVIIRGHRHGDCFINVFNRKDKDDYTDSEQGFVTSKNRFVTREEGRKLQDAAGIESAEKDGGYRYNTLFSEDLY